MTLYQNIKSFVGKIINNPLKTGIVAYLIYKILSKETKQESFSEKLEVIKKRGDLELVHDEEADYYAVINKSDVSYFDNLSQAKKSFDKALHDSGSESLEEGLRRLKEKYAGRK